MAIIISVCVISYNQEQYIEKCLDSIIEQELDCEFELIIRDDGSQDRTPFIIRDYTDKYKNLIKILPGEKNIGANANLLTTFSACQGEFIALCEGDDFWTDKQKLQKQLNQARKFPEAEFFTHPASIGSVDKVGSKIWPCQASACFSLKDILLGFGQFAPTSSYFFRRDALGFLPSWFTKAPIGDFFMELYLTGEKNGCSLTEVMSHYRTASIGSWDDKISKDRSGEKGVKAYRLIKIYLKKAIVDFPEYKYYFIKRLEYINLAIAHQYMKSGNYSCFLLYINKAGAGVCRIGVSARILFYFRNVKLIVLFLYKLKKSF
jgi:glycosyltransferase involved in cell wall biosynthesis